jgi:SSS family solute:Na+ symporter
MKTMIPLLAAASPGAKSTLTSIDWLAIALYFSILLCVAWWIIGASIFASNIGSEHIVGLAGSGAKDGVAMAHYELHAWCLLVLAWVFVPFYARSLVFTMPEFLERRFSTPSRYVLSIVSLITFVVSKIAVGIFAGGVVFATLLPEVHLDIGSIHINSFWIGSVAVIVLTGLYTMLGGMRAVAYNDAVQVLVLIIGSSLLTVYGLIKLGGWQELRTLAGSDMFNLWKPLIPAGVESTWAPVKEINATGQVVRQAWYFNDYYPWLGMLFCAPIIGLWYWCTDQYIVQRALGAPNEQIARRGSIFAAYLKLFPPYLFIIPGMICFALVKSGKVPALTEAFAAHPDAAQGAFPLMVEHLLPAGLRGIVVAGLLSALMGSLAGVFNACSTLFTVDLYEKWKPGLSQAQIVRVGRIATAVMVFVALLWIPVIQGARGLYNYLQSVQGYLAPPIFVVFFFGVFWKRLNAQGCFWAMVVGFTLGLFRMIVDTPVALGVWGYQDAAKTQAIGYSAGSFLWIVNSIYFQYFSVLITIVSAVVMVLVSYVTAAPDDEKIRNLTFATTTDDHRAESRASWNKWDLATSAMVLQVILAGYGYFSTVKGGETYIGFAPYPLVWAIALIAAAIATTSPKWRSSTGPLAAGTVASVIGFAIAFVLTRFVFRGLVALVAMPILHGGFSDAYSYSTVMVFGFVASLFACPVGAIIGFATGYDALAARQPAAGRAKLA